MNFGFKEVDLGESAFLQDIGAAIVETGPTALRDVEGRLNALFKETVVPTLLGDAAAHLRSSRGDFAVRAAE